MSINRKILFITENSIQEKLIEYYKKRAEDKMEILVVSYNAIKCSNLISVIRTQNPDILINFNLSGFELCTLTDNVSYNLLNCKQIHILLDRNLKNEKYLSKPLSIAMFFYCWGEKYYDYLIHAYPDLPYLRNIQEWQAGNDELLLEKNTKILENIIQDVIEQTRI